MAQLRILAIEDDPIHASRLAICLEELGYSLIEIIDNATDALRLFRATKPDLVLMDIGLKDETDGISIAEKINGIAPIPIIYITAFTDKETFDRAKETSPYAYLIKPIEKASLQTSIELAVFHFAKDSLKEGIGEAQFNQASEGILAKDYFFVKTGNGMEKIKHDDVLWIAVTSDRYCEVVTHQKKFSMRSSLKNLEKKLPSHQFMRPHRTYIVNISKVESLHGQDMMLGIGPHRIPIGKGRRQAVMELLNVL